MHRCLRGAVIAAVIGLLSVAVVACGGGKKSSPAATETRPAATSTNATAARTSTLGGGAAFHSYHYEVELNFRVRSSQATPGGLINGVVEGDFVAPDSHAFTSSFQLGGLSYSESAVIVGDDAWYRQGDGAWRATTRQDGDVQDAISLTSADPGFLQDPEFSSNLSALTSEPDTINGVETRRYHIPKEAIQALSQLLGGSFLEDVAGLEEFEMTVWLEKETLSLVRAELAATASPDVFGPDAPFEVAQDASVSINMLINLTKINDESISIEPPI